MSDATTHLLLPYILAAQAQKHVTHNEVLRLLDGLVQLAVLDRDGTTPPASPADGDRHIVAAGATGDWTGWEGSVAYYVDGAWMRLVPRPGWLAWVESEEALFVWTGTAWPPLEAALGLVALGANVRLTEAPSGAATDMAVFEELLSDLSGPSVDSTALIPDRALVLCVSTRTVTDIAGATSYDCGLAGEPAKFGASLGVAAGSENVGVSGPTAFHAPTAIRLTANGADFAGGAVRIAIHCILPRAPQA